MPITNVCHCSMCRADRLIDEMRGTTYAPPVCDYCGETDCNGRECRECAECGSIYCEDMNCRRCGDCGCIDCECEEYDGYGDSSGRGLMSYSYSPELVFHGNGTKTFLGLEIEVSAEYAALRRAIATANEALGPLGYLKEDGSVQGFEICCQPMTYDWAMANFPWEMFAALESDGCEIIPSTNGIHVHISRDGFSSPAHLYRWMKFWYRNERDISRIARRRPNQWARYEDSHREAHLIHAKKHGKAPRLDRYGNERDYDGTKGTRYSAINTTNENTLEVRVFASTLDATEAKACIALVSASVEYTRQLRAHDVAANDGWSWEAFRKYITAAGGKYAALVTIDGNI